MPVQAYLQQNCHSHGWELAVCFDSRTHDPAQCSPQWNVAEGALAADNHIDGLVRVTAAAANKRTSLTF
jgi:hypothetical protein